MSVVVDASVAVAWFVPERPDDAHYRLLESNAPLLAPDLVYLEVASALARKARRGELRDGDAPRMLAQLRGLAMTSTPFAQLLDEAVALSLSLRHAVQDCLYLALARREGASLATFDARQRQHARSLAIPIWTPA